MLIEMRDIHKTYRMGRNPVHALAGVDLEIETGEMLAVMGPSGSGKSTLMNILGCLDRPTKGEYVLEGTPVEGMDNDQLALIHGRKIGFVFQTFNLLARTPALNNVMLPLLYNRAKNRRQKAEAALERVAMADRMDHKPSELSGGEQQRVAIARALVTQPAILLADEPTGNLDSKTSVEIMHLFRELHDEGVTVVLVTHDEEIGQCARRVVRMRDGLIVGDAPAPHVYPTGAYSRESEPGGADGGGAAGPSVS
ncbi:MAG: ABC transporter ATP-binding protein [Armatimonadota bacterium]|jgi:putative ABC transport system ATP-binding protein